MKLNGQRLEPRRVTLVFPGERVFVIKAVLNDDVFNTYCPEPQPKMITRKDSTVPVPYVTDKKYLEQMNEHAKLRSLWMILESLSETPGLEWETIKMEDPSTWKNFYEELRTSGLTMFEQSKLIEAVMNVNIVTDEAISEATKAFLATRSEAAKK